MRRSRGRICKNKVRTQAAIRWVDDDRKCTFKTPTVTHMDRVTKIIVNNRYLPNKGTARLVGCDGTTNKWSEAIGSGVNKMLLNIVLLLAINLLEIDDF